MAYSRKHADGDEAGHYVSARQEREQEKRHSPVAIRPPMTSMIDVVFLLLLFFLLACQFRADEGQITANLPCINDGPAPTPICVILRPVESGVLIRVQHSDVVLVDVAEFYEYLIQMKRRHDDEAGEVPVYIKPVSGVQWDYVVDAFNQAVRAGYKRIGFAPSEMTEAQRE